MKRLKLLSKLLLSFHLFVCLVWLYVLRTQHEHASWASHVILLSILAIQFTWSFTVGLTVGPEKSKRSNLWWSLLTLFMPLCFFGPLSMAIFFYVHPILGLLYLSTFVMILSCETYCGVLLGAKIHNETRSK